MQYYLVCSEKFTEFCELVLESANVECGAVQKLESLMENTSKKQISAEIGIPDGEAWENHPENPNEKSVQTLDAKAENVK